MIQQIATSCRQRQIRCVVFTVSTSLQVYPDPHLRQRIAQQCGAEDLFYAERRMQALCEQQQIEFVPLASSLQALADANAAEYLHGFRNTQMGIGHWSAAGHRAAATVLAEYLARTSGINP